MRNKVICKFIPAIVLVAVMLTLVVFYAVTLNRDNDLDISEVNLARSGEVSGSAGSGLAFDGSALTA